MCPRSNGAAEPGARRSSDSATSPAFGSRVVWAPRCSHHNRAICAAIAPIRCILTEVDIDARKNRVRGQERAETVAQTFGVCAVAAGGLERKEDVDFDLSV